MVRDSAAAPSVKGPPVRRTIQPSTPVEESVTEGMAEIRPAVDRRMLMPAEEPATAAIRPVKVMKPQESEGGYGIDKTGSSSSSSGLKISQ